MSARHERGQAVLVMVVAVAVFATVALMIVAAVGRGAGDAARARTAADAAALAGAVGGRTSAEALAQANGGRVVTYSDEDGRVDVTVEVGGSEARASAVLSFDDPALAGDGPGTYTPPRAG